ncbi:MAG: hypothetical protein V4619_11520 [Bacteroidota bacterium]
MERFFDLIKRPVLSLLIAAQILVSCQNGSNKINVATKSESKIFNPADSTYVVPEQQDNNVMYPTARPATFANTRVYTLADTLSEVKTIIPPFTFFKVLSSEWITHEDTLNNAGNGPYTQSSMLGFLKVKLDNGTEGYIVDDNIAFFTFTDDAGIYLYLAGTYIQKGETNKPFIKVVKYDIKAKKIIRSVTHNGYSETIFEVNRIKNLPLKNVEFCLRVNAHGDFCGGTQTMLFMVDKPTGMSFLPESVTFLADGGGLDATIIYIPAINGKGKICLYPDADTGTKDTLAYPSNLKYPLNETIIMINNEGQQFVNDDYLPILSKNGEVRWEYLKQTINYYHWDGKVATRFYSNTSKLNKL